MTTLGIDIGSSSVKAGILRGTRVVGRISRQPFHTTFDGTRAEVAPREILRALRIAVSDLGRAARSVDVTALGTMSPAWVAMDERGRALTAIVTHQDRRSINIAGRLESRIGCARHLKLAGNRPFPGGISSTTCAWYLSNEPALMRKAALLGHLNTFLHRQLTGARVIDASNASFTGLYLTPTQRGWSDELCHNAGVRLDQLPEILPGDAVGGALHAAGARLLSLRQGTPMLVGCVDTSAAMLLAGAEPGQLVNVSGSTDVLALCVDHPRPHPQLLTRALGVGRLWMSVSTLAAAGSSLTWIKEQLFSEMSNEQFFRLVDRLSLKPQTGGVSFDPYLAGERDSMEQSRAAFHGLTLSTTRMHMLAAVIESLASASARRLELLRADRVTMRKTVLTSGGTGSVVQRLLHRDWPGTWRFVNEPDATLRGLGKLAEAAR